MADGLFDGQQLGLVETAQAAVDMFQHRRRALYVARQQQLLRGEVQHGFRFVNQPVDAPFGQLLIRFLRQQDLFAVCHLGFAQALQFGLDSGLAV